MKRFQSVLCASLLTLAIGSTAFAKSGTISATRAGTISATRVGTISATTAGTISTTKAGTISATQVSTGNTASTNVDRFSFDLTNYLFMLMPSLW